MDDLLFQSAGHCAALIRKKELSPVELTRAVLAHIDAINPALRAFVFVDHERALEQARLAQTAVTSGKPLGPLHGVPYSLKDNIDIRGLPSSNGLMAFRNNVAGSDSPVAYLARAAGAICIGKTALPEFGWDSATETPLHGITRNPWALSRSAGGSSGGAGAALAAGMAPLAIATDGGGSIRQPASFNGVVGFKASAGLVPIYPPSRFAPIGHLGPMARTVEDVALLLDAIAGVDPRAEASLERSFAASCTGDLAGYRIGYSSTVNGHAVDREVSTLVENWLTTLSDAGASVEPIELAADGFEETWEALYLFATMKLYETLSSEAKAELSADFLAFIDKARNVTNEAAMRAELRRHDIVRQVFQATQYFDLVVTPTTPTVAFPAGRQELLDTHNDAYAGTRSFRLTQLWNLTGQPALSLPVGWTTAGMPVGAQIIGHLNEDALVLRAAKAGERPLNRRPAL